MTVANRIEAAQLIKPPASRGVSDYHARAVCESSLLDGAVGGDDSWLSIALVATASCSFEVLRYVRRKTSRANCHEHRHVVRIPVWGAIPVTLGH